MVRASPFSPQGSLLAAMIAVSFAHPCNAYAEMDRDTLPLAGGSQAAYVDLYLQDPQVSGNLLVGVRWANTGASADPQAKFDPDDVRLTLPAQLFGSTACVDITSKDGRYTAENLYSLPPGTVHQPRLEVKTKFQTYLNSYPVDSMAVMIRAVSSCDASDVGKIIPAVLVPQDSNSTVVLSEAPALFAYVNADPDRVALSLMDSANTKLLEAHCHQAGEGVQISYSATCLLQPSKPLMAGQYRLHLETKERFKTVASDFDLLISK